MLCAQKDELPEYIVILNECCFQSFCGHKSSVRSLSFSSSSTMCSGSVSGEIRVWSVPNFTCVGCFQAHSGATEVLIFLDEGRMLLSASSDHTVRYQSVHLKPGTGILRSANVFFFAHICFFTSSDISLVQSNRIEKVLVLEAPCIFE